MDLLQQKEWNPPNLKIVMPRLSFCDRIVVGLGFGDEGKGKVVDWLCQGDPPNAVVRFSGGQQAGHTVVTEVGARHVFANLGSGTLRGVPTLWSEHCTLDPVGLLNELDVLKKWGWVSPKIYIHENCPITTPLDKGHQLWDRRNLKHGTCGVGVGSTWVREEAHYHLRFRDLAFPSILRMKFQMIQDYYSKATDEAAFIRDCQDLLNRKEVFPWGPFRYENFIFEGSQGLLLDSEFGFFPHVTRSRTGTLRARKMAVNPDVWLVTRAYQTRHGNGPMTNGGTDRYILKDKNETNRDDGIQGVFRRSILDLDLLKYGMEYDEYIRTLRLNRPEKLKLVVTCLDHLERLQLTERGQVYDYAPKDYPKFLRHIGNALGIEEVWYGRDAGPFLTRI